MKQLTREEHIMNILRDVAKEGAVCGRRYLEEKAKQILSYVEEKKPELVFEIDRDVLGDIDESFQFSNADKYIDESKHRKKNK